MADRTRPQAPSAAQQALLLAREGRAHEARATIEAAIGRNDAEALFVRGLWRIEGKLLEQDLEGARADIGESAAAGVASARRIHAGLLATGTGGPADWKGALAVLASLGADPAARRELALVEAMDLDENGAPRIMPKAETLHAQPNIGLIRGLCSPDECRLLIELASPRFRPAMIFHEGQGRFVRDPIRDSEAASFPVIAEGPFVRALNRRFAAATATEPEQGETLQVLRYGPGQQYREHLDALPALDNQRALTLLVYLNDDYEGGETRFTELGLDVRGRTGDALIFANADIAGRPDPRSRHAGLPVGRGSKLLASRWIRQRPPDDPRGFGRHEAETRR